MTTTTTPNGNYHPACLLLPEMGEDEFRELARDIYANGQRHPIIVDEAGLILDGRHRWRALAEMDCEPQTIVFRGSEEEKVALVISENIHRRHLSTQQRAAIAAELATMKRGTRTDLASNDATSSTGPSDAQAAKVMRVSEKTVERAKSRMRSDPEAHAKAKAGTLGRRRPKHPIREPKDAPAKPAPVADLALDLAELNAAWPRPTLDAYLKTMTEQQAANIRAHLIDLRLKLGVVLQAAERARDLSSVLTNGAARNTYAERGARIRATRKERGLSLKQLGELAAVNHVQAGLAERGLVRKSGKPAYEKLETALGLST